MSNLMYRRSRSARFAAGVAAAIALTLAPLGVGAGNRSGTATSAPRAATATAKVDRAPVASTLAKLPMRFEVNRSQTDARARFVARGGTYTAFLTDDGPVVSVREARPTPRRADPRATNPGKRDGERRDVSKARVVRLGLAGAASSARVVGEGDSTPSNYLLGQDRSAWRTNVATYTRVRYAGVYPGVDAVFHGDASTLSCTLEVAPGADLSAVRLRYEGTSGTVGADGSLALEGFDGRTLTASAAQIGATGKRAISARFAGGGGDVTIDAGDYDRTKALVVEVPAIAVAFLGGDTGVDIFRDAAVDATGATYVAGIAYSSDFPTTPGAIQASTTDGDFFLTKIAPDGASLVYSTLIPAEVDLNADDYSEIAAIAVDGSGNVAVAGFTSAPIVTTPGAYDTTPNGGNDAFVMKVNATGTALVYATYLGGTGSDRARDVAFDAAGAAYVVGETTGDFPVTSGAYDTTPDGDLDAFVAKLSANGAALTYSTYLGGSAGDLAAAVAVDASGRATVAGSTSSDDLPTTAGAVDTTANGASDGFVSGLSAGGAALEYSTYLGGSDTDYATDVVTDAAGAVYVTGVTRSSDFPATAGAFDVALGGENDTFVAKIAAGGASLAYATYLGGVSDDNVVAITVDASGRAVVAGSTASPDYPTTPGAYDTSLDSSGGAFVTKLSADGSALAFSTVMEGNASLAPGSVAVLGDGSVVVAGSTSSLDFPAPSSLPGVVPDEFDAIVVKIAADGSALVYGALLGGSHGVTAYDSGLSLAVDASENVYLAGLTMSVHFPATSGVVDETYNGLTDAFVAKLSPDLSSLVYATYVGGLGEERELKVAVDSSGEAILAGETYSPDFPTTPGAVGGVFAGDRDAFVTKLDATGSSLLLSTYLGGASAETLADVRVDAAGAIYVAGSTDSSDFPTTPGAYDRTLSVADGFVTKLSATGTAFVYSTYLGDFTGGFDSIEGLAVDAAGEAVVVGSTLSISFPTTPGAYDTEFSVPDGFCTKLSADGSSLVYSTYLGGEGVWSESARAVALDATGAAYVAGVTENPGFPVTPGGFDTTPNGSYDVFVSKLDPTGSTLVYSTFLGSDDFDVPEAIAVDASGSAYVVGETDGTNFPTTPGAFDDDGLWFVTRLTPDGSALLYSTHLDEPAFGIALIDGGVAVVGGTRSTTFAQDGFGINDGSNAYVIELATTGFTVRGADTIGVYVRSSGAWFLSNHNSAGGADLAFTYGAANTAAVVLSGDWDGDGVDTPGLYDAATGAFFLENTNASGGADLVFTFGAGGAGFVPVVGDWDGDGVDTIGLYAPSTSAFFLKNANASGGADLAFVYGPAGAGWKPIAGDWNNDGVDTVGLYAPGTGTFFLANTNASGPAALAFGYGPANLVPLAGDWNGDGVDTVGLYNPATGAYFLKNANGGGGADALFVYGGTGLEPLTGDWDGL